MERKANGLLIFIAAAIFVYLIARVIAIPKMPLSKQEIVDLIVLGVVALAIIATVNWAKKSK